MMMMLLMMMMMMMMMTANQGQISEGTLPLGPARTRSQLSTS